MGTSERTDHTLSSLLQVLLGQSLAHQEEGEIESCSPYWKSPHSPGSPKILGRWEWGFEKAQLKAEIGQSSSCVFPAPLRLFGQPVPFMELWVRGWPLGGPFTASLHLGLARLQRNLQRGKVQAAFLPKSGMLNRPHSLSGNDAEYE